MNKLFSPALYCVLTALLVSEPAIAGDKGMRRMGTRGKMLRRKISRLQG